MFMRLFGFERAPADSGREWNVVSLAPGTSGGAAGAVVVTVMAVIVVWILAFILMCSMIFRSFALIVLAAVAPVALMLMPWEKTKTWARRWCEIVVALLLAKPLAATVLAVAIKLFAESKSFAGLAAGVVGMALACGAPLMALRLVSFAGGELAAAAQTAGGGHVLSRTSSFAARQISRQTGGRFTLAGDGWPFGDDPPDPVESSPISHPRAAATVPRCREVQRVQRRHRLPAGNAGALMLDAGTSAASPASPQAKRRTSRARYPGASASGTQTSGGQTPASHHGRRRRSCRTTRHRSPRRPSLPSTSHESSSPQPTVISMSETSRTLEAVKFPRYERRGLFMGLKWYQLLLLAAGVVVASRGIGISRTGRLVRVGTVVAGADAPRLAAVFTDSVPGMGQPCRPVLLPVDAPDKHGS